MVETNLFLGGMFNNTDPIFFLPLYFWAWIFQIVMIIITWTILWWVWWKPNTPFHGLYYGWKNMSYAAFICDKALQSEMVSERHAKCIFDYSKMDHNTFGPYAIDVPWADVPIIGMLTAKIYIFLFYYPTKYLEINPLDALRFKISHVNKDVEIAKKLQKGEWDRHPSVVCGGVPVDIIIDTDNWTIPNSPQHRAIEKSAIEWNKKHPNDQVHSYTKYQRYLIYGDKNKEKIPQPPEIKLDFKVDWTRIETSFPMDLEENDWAGKRRQMALDRARDKEVGDRWRMALMIIGGSILIGLVIAIVRFAAFWMAVGAK